MNKKEQIYYECIGVNKGKQCGAGMEIYIDEDGNQKKHRVSFEAEIGEFTLTKEGQLIEGRKCYKCRKKTLIKL